MPDTALRILDLSHPNGDTLLLALLTILPHLLECMTNNDWQVRKMAIDVIYTMAAILRDALANYKSERYLKYLITLEAIRLNQLEKQP
jgi:hypothetical protein